MTRTQLGVSGLRRPRVERWIPWLIAWTVARGLAATPTAHDEPSAPRLPSPASTTFSAATAVSASASASGTSPRGAVDGDRFGLRPDQLWQGQPGTSNWWWEIRFPAPQRVGALLQISGDHEFVFRHGPTRYVWQASRDGRVWEPLRETRQTNESRCFRLHRLSRAREVLALRLVIDAADGSAPVLREVECYADARAQVEFPPWAVVVNTTHDSTLPGHGQEFIPLLHSTGRGRGFQAQQVWLDRFEPAWIAIEPRPVCAFLSGNFKDWCEVDRRRWRGTEAILRRKNLPMWASCGGAQGLAILAETGTRKPWDCPHCRDQRRPRLPIYGHIGHTAVRACGDYSGCVFERGPHEVLAIGPDPVWAGLPPRFQVMESHCGQIEWAPKGWELIATAGAGTLTKTQCLRLKGKPIYAAQFHIEMAGTPAVSERIMDNFLALALAWQGRQEGGADVGTAGR